MAELTNKKKRRGGHCSYVTRTITAVKGILENYELSNEIKLRQQKIILEEQLGTLQSLDDQILELLTDDTQTAMKIDESGEFRAGIHEIMIRIDKLLISKEDKTQSEQVVTSKTGASAKLPKLQVPKFPGNPCQWNSFWDSFFAGVHNREELTDVERFSYLRGLLTDTAAATISGFTLTEANYENPTTLLKQRYGHPQIIINSHMDQLMQIQRLGPGSNVTRLRSMLDEIQTHVRALHSLGVSSDHYGSLLVSVLFKGKLPSDIKLLIGRKLQDQDWTLDDVLKVLHVQIETREKCGLSNPNSDYKTFATQSHNKRHSTAAALLSSEKKIPTCTYCNGKHASLDCKIVTSIGARKQILRQSGCCYVCLKKNHIASNCNSTSSCYECQSRHHVSICKGDRPKRKQETSACAGAAKEPSEIDKHEISYSGYVSGGIKNTVLLQTAKVKLTNPDYPANSITARLIFDMGSQRSYLQQNVQQMLNLETVGKVKMLINTFGQPADQLKPCDLVNITVGSTHAKFKLNIETLVVPEICAPLQKQELTFGKGQYSHLQGIDLADDVDDSSEVEIELLIGCDHIWKFLMNDVRRGESGHGSVATKTRLGWVLSGPIEVGTKDTLASVNFVATHVLFRANEEIDFEPKEMCPNLEQKVQSLWDLDSVGIRDHKTVHEAFLKNISFEKGRYTVQLSFRNHHYLIPDNYEFSLARLNSLVKRLRKEPSLLRDYNQIKIPEPGAVYYIPHQAVIRKQALTTRFRIVFDASSKLQKNLPSLNDCIYTGPALMPAIMDILLRFRAWRYGLIADVEKTFHQVAIDETQ